jgi:hypothetical protein
MSAGRSRSRLTYSSPSTGCSEQRLTSSEVVGMRLCWNVLLLVGMVWPLWNPLTSASSAHAPKNVLVLYADRPDLPGHRVFEDSLRSSLTASVATRLDSFPSRLMTMPQRAIRPAGLVQLVTCTSRLTRECCSRRSAGPSAKIRQGAEALDGAVPRKTHWTT